MTAPTVTPETTRRDMLMAALVALRDVVDGYEALSPPKRKAALLATAGYLADLRASGVLS